MMGKKDFSGKNKTSDTYDKDWKLTKVRGPHGTCSMAWVTNKQAKQMRTDEKEAKAYRASMDAASMARQPNQYPSVSAPPATAPIVSPIQGGLPTPPQTGDPKNGIPPAPPTPDTQIPSWWINQAITNPTTEEQKFANVANALLPTLAPEDQRTLASFLAQNYKDVYGGYSNTKFNDAPTEITDAVRKQYLSPQRAQVALSLLDKMKSASGVQDMGAGYDYLKNAVNLINQFTTDGVMTRERYQQFTNAV